VFEISAVSIVSALVEQKNVNSSKRDLLVLFRGSVFLSKFGLLLIVQCLCCGVNCEKLKSLCENLGAVFSSDVQ